jgi:Uma2 family endonuclease
MSITFGGESTERFSFSTPVKQKTVTSSQSLMTSGSEETKKRTPPKKNTDIIDSICDVTRGNTKLAATCSDIESFMEITRCLERKKCHKKLSFNSVTGEIIVREVPSRPHEIVNRAIEKFITMYNHQLTGDVEDPIESTGSTTFIFGDRVLEPDSSFSNIHAPFTIHGHPLPTIIVEIAFDEGWAGLVSNVNHYLQTETVRMVITIKLIGNPGENRINYFVCVLHTKQDDGSINVKVINFGKGPLHGSTVRAIQDHLKIPPGDPRFVGVGYGYNGPFPYPIEHLPADDMLTIEIPVGVIWYQVPQVDLNFVPTPIRIDLRTIYNLCVKKRFCENPPVIL